MLWLVWCPWLKKAVGQVRDCRRRFAEASPKGCPEGAKGRSEATEAV